MAVECRWVQCLEEISKGLLKVDYFRFFCAWKALCLKVRKVRTAHELRKVIWEVGCAFFTDIFGNNRVLIDHSELSAFMPSFSKLDIVYLCLWAIFDSLIRHFIVTKSKYFVRYYICNKRKLTENWIEEKVNNAQILKTWYSRT